MNAFLLLGIGLLLIFLEFFLPGAVMGIAGTIFVVISIIVFAGQSDSPLEIFLFIVGALVSLGILIKFALWKIKHGKAGTTIYSDDDQEGYIASTYDKSTIGKVGKVSTDLKPGGHIIIDGKQHSAISQSGYIKKGDEVVVVSGEGETLNVKLHTKEKL